MKNSKEIKIKLTREGVKEKDLLAVLSAKCPWMKFEVVFRQKPINHIQLLVIHKKVKGFHGLFYISLNDACLYDFQSRDKYTIDLVDKTLQELMQQTKL